MTNDLPRVFHLITRFLNGGAENVITRTITGLDNFEVTVGYGASYHSDRVEALAAAGVQTRSFPLIRHYNPITAFPAVLSLARYFRREKFDIVHTHSTEAGIIGRAAAALADIPNIVHTIHGVPFTEDRNPLLNAFVERCERWVAPYTDRIVAIADVIADEYLMRDIGVPEQYITIYCGISVETFADAEPAYDLPGEQPRLLMVSRLSSGKGFGVLFNAIERLNSPISLLIVGDGPERETLQSEIQERELGDTVYLLGFRDDIPQVMAASNVLVHPSFREGTPLVIFEAMASGLPVVATNVAGIPEQVTDGETGYLVEPGDAKALATRLERLIKSPKRRTEFSKKAREKAECFNSETMVNRYRDLYQELLYR